MNSDSKVMSDSQKKFFNESKAEIIVAVLMVITFAYLFIWLFKELKPVRGQSLISDEGEQILNDPIRLKEALNDLSKMN